MAQELSVKAELLSQEVNISQNIILEIDGVDLVFGAQPIFRIWRIGEDGVEVGDEGLTIGGLFELPNSRAYVSLDGTTNQITQQLELDRGGAGSVTKFSIQLVDKNQELTRTFSPDQIVSDLLGRRATVYLGFQGGSHPDDSIRLFQGVIDAQEIGAGFWKVTVAHPQTLTRASILQQITSEIPTAIDDIQTTITVDSTEGYLTPTDSMRTLIRIEDELIEYTGLTATDFTGCTRGVETTLATSHDEETEVTSYFIFEDNPIDLALKFMLSRDGTPAFSGIEIDRFVQTAGFETLENAVIFPSETFQDEYGLIEGDFITITGAVEGANNVADYPISSFVVGTFGTAIILGGAGLVYEIGTDAVCSFKSQYDVFPVTKGGVSAGANMTPQEVDVAKHVELQELLTAQIPDVKLYSEGDENLKEMIVNELFQPIGFYQVPKARYSLAAVIPPLVVDRLKKFDSDAVKNPDKLKLSRTINKNFYNSITFKFNPDPINLDKYTAGEVVFSQRSVNRIDTNTKNLEITSRGLKGDEATRNTVKALTRRLEDRYQFAPETIEVKTNYKTGFNVEIADVVLFGDNFLQLPDITEASRNFKPRLMEVINRKLNLKTGDLQYTLLDTAAGLDGRFSVVSPNSYVDTGSSTAQILLKRSFTTGEFELERQKWENFIGEEILVRSEDYTYQEVVTLIGFSEDTLYGLDVTPFTVVPSEDYIVDLPYYPETAETDDRRIMKAIHAFFTPRVTITANSADNFTFEVDPSDIDKFLVGAFVRVHSDDFIDDSVESSLDDDAEVVDVNTTTNIVTVDRDLTFTPQLNNQVDLIGFKDGGLPYRLL